MNISIIIPTINRYSDLKNTIKYLKDQSITDFEIIIIDQSDKIIFEDLTKLDNRIIHFHTENKSASAARNQGILKSKNDILLFLDDDVIIQNTNFLHYHLLPYMEDEKLSGIFGSVLELRVNQKPTLKRHIWSHNDDWGWLFFPQNYDKFARVNSARSCNLSVRKRFAIDVGGMDENYSKGAHREEADFCFRLTKKYGSLLFSPKARLIHIGNATGGIRSWDASKRSIHAQQHFDGALYFVFKNVALIHFGPHFISILLFFFYRKEFMKKPHLIFIAVYRLIVAIRNAIRLLLKEPKYLDS